MKVKFKSELLNENIDIDNIKEIGGLSKAIIGFVYKIKEPFVAVEVFPIESFDNHTRQLQSKITYRLKKEGFSFVGTIAGYYVKSL